MAIDLTGFRADTTALLALWGESVDIHRLTVDWDTVPPTETWANDHSETLEIQPTAGMKIRHDAGLLINATHWAMAEYDADIVVTDRIFRGGITNYYDVLRVDNLEDHLEIWMKFVEGAA